MNRSISAVNVLEDTETVEKGWQRSKELFSEKCHPDDFPVLPEFPVARYVDPEFCELETEHVWNKIWILAGFASEVPDAGSYKTADIIGKPVLIVRAEDGEIKAFHNVCQHRGIKLCPESQGQTSRFRCRYHGWTYGLSGELIYVPQEHEFPALNKGERPLAPLRCERLGNLIFVSFNDDAPPLETYLGEIAELAADVPFDRVVLHETLSWDVECNWKCVQDAFSESFHVAFAHSRTAHKTIDSTIQVRYMFENGHNSSYVKAREGLPGIYNDKVTGERTMKPLTYLATRVYNLFPSLTIPIEENVFTIIEAVPVSVSKSRIRVHFLKDIGKDSVDIDALADKAVEAFAPVVEEDVSMLCDMYAALSGGGIKTTPLCHLESLLYNYHQEIDRLIGPENIPDECRLKPVDLPIIRK